MYNIENSTVNHSVRSWEWDRYDEWETTDDWEADNYEEYGAPYDYYED